MSREIERKNSPPTRFSVPDPDVGPNRLDTPGALVRFGDYALVHSEIADVLEEAVGLLVTHLGVEFSKVLELLPDQEAFMLRAGVGWSPGLIGKAIVSARTDLLPGNAMLSKTPVTIEDLSQETRFAVPSVLHEHNVRSGVAIAIHGEKRPYGVLGVYSTKPRKFSTDDIHFLQVVANVVTAAIRRQEGEDERNRLRRETTAQMQRLAVLQEISAAVTSTLELDSVLDVLMDKVDTLLPYSAIALWLVNADSGELTRTVCRNFDEAEWKRRTIPGLPPILQRVLQQNAPVHVRNMQTDYRIWNRDFYQRHGLVSYLALPLVARGEVLGILSFCMREEYLFADEEVSFLTMLGRQAAIAIKNSRLYEQGERHTQELSALNAVTTAASQSLELDDVLDEVIRKVTDIFSFDLTRVYLLEDESTELRPRASYEIEPELMMQMPGVSLGQGNVGHVAATGEPLIFEDVSKDPRYSERSRGGRTRKAGLRFFAVFPIKSKARTVGTIVCSGRKARRLSIHEIHLVTTMASQIGVAVENAKLFAETRERNRELSTLYHVARTVSQSLKIDEVLKSLMSEVLSIFEFDAARIYLYDTAQRELRLQFQQGFPEPDGLPTCYTPGEGVIGLVFEAGEPIHFEDIRRDPEFERLGVRPTAFEEGYPGGFFIPVAVKGSSTGVIHFASRRPRRFSLEEVRLIHSIADQLGLALENANLFEQATRSSAELESLVNTNREIAAVLERETLLPRIAEEAIRLLKADGGNFRVVEGDQLVEYSPLHPSESAFRRSFGISEGLTGKVVREGRPIAIADLFKSDEILNEHRSVALRYGYRAFLGVPLRVGGRVLGSINLYCKNERIFSEQEVALMSAFASQAAVAMENAKLFTEIQNQTSKLRELNQELREANETKSNFLSSMSHELRTPLQVILGYSALLADGFGGALSAAQKEALETIHHNSEVYLQLIENVLTLTKLEANRMALDITSQALPETLKHVTAFVANLNRADRLAVVWDVAPDLPVMRTDHLKIEEILQNLIGNAYKFTRDGRISIRVRYLGEEDAVEFTVADTGIGIEPDQLESIFDEFHQLEGAHTGDLKGVGLGLSIVRQYLQMLGGRILVESDPGVGTTFTVYVPRSQPL